MKILLLLLVLLFTSELANAQSPESRQLGDDLRFPNLPFYSYGSGLGFTTPDSTFRLNIRFRMQNRTTYVIREDADDSIEATVRRLRLRFDGFVGDPRFLYAIQLSFAPGDVGEISPGDNINIIRDAVFYYQPNRFWSIGFGQTKLPGNRQRINSSGALQLTDRSINNARFTIDRDYGIFINYQDEDTERFSWGVKSAISTGDGRNYTRNPDTNLAYTTRLELYPLGAFLGNGALFEGDIKREQTPKVLLGATYHYNQGAKRTRGQTGSDLFESRDLTSIHLDAMLKYQGFAFQTAWMNRTTDNPLTVDFEDPSLTNVVQTGNGYDFQMSYIFPSDYEIIGRFSAQAPGRIAKNIEPKTEQISFGLTRYIWEHALKMQAEVSQTRFTFPDSSSRNDWYLRFQIEIGI